MQEMELKRNIDDNNIENFVAKLRRGEEQIMNGEVTDATTVFKNLKEKYGLEYSRI